MFVTFVWNSEYPGLLRHQVGAIDLSEYERAKDKREKIYNVIAQERRKWQGSSSNI